MVFRFSDFKRSSTRIRFLFRYSYTLFHWNTVFLDLIPPKYIDCRRYSTKIVILDVIPQK